jgi:uncharacterized protein involved in exopolysaccharide biosynthesis/Mg-chelatase subunit ChlD/anti-sigma factor RsiW
MTPDPTNPRHALEASLTALLLGELPPDQAAFLRQAIATDPELARMYAQLERTINLVRETAAEPIPGPAVHPQLLRLSSERREQLLQRFKTVDHPALAKPERKDRSWLVPTAIAASMLLLVGALGLSELSKSRVTSGDVTELRRLNVVVNQDAANVPRAVAEGGQSWYTLGANRNGRWPTDSSPATPAPYKRPEVAGRNIVSVHSGDAASFSATPPTTIFLPPKLPESESELARTAKALDGSTAGNASFSLGGGMGGGGGGRAPATAPAENRPLDEHRDTLSTFSPGPAHEEALSRRYGLRGVTKSEAKEPQAQVGKPTVTYSAQDRTAGTPTSGTQFYAGGFTNALVSPDLDGDVPSFKEVPAQQKQELAVEQDINEALRRRALTPAREPAKDAERIPRVNVDPTAGLPLAAAAPSVDPTTGLPLSNASSEVLAKIRQKNGGVLQIDDSNGLSKDLRRSETTSTLVAGDYQWQFPAGGTPNVGSLGRTSTPSSTQPEPYSLGVAGYANLPAQAAAGYDSVQQWSSSKLRDGLRTTGEKTDLQLPKNSMVEIVDKATAKQVESPSLGQKLSGLVSGKVERSARIKVERDQSDIAGVAGVSEKQTTAGYDPYFVKTEAEVIQSDAVLGAVVDKLKLDEAWAKKRGTSTPLPKSEAVKMLKEQLDVKSVGKTDLLDIGVKSDKPEEAANLANAVAESYRARRLEQRKELAQAEVASLQDRLAENEQRIREAQTDVDALREKYKISDYMAGGTAPTVLITAETLRRIEQLRIESQAELSKQQTLLTKLTTIRNDPDALANVISTNGIQDQVLGSLLEQKALTGQKLASLQNQYGPENIETKKAAAMADDLKSKINNRVADVISGLEARVTSLGQSLTNLQVEVDKAMKTDLQKTSEHQPYWEAKQHLEELQRLGQVLSMKIAGEKTEAEKLIAGRNDDARPPKPTTPPPEPQPEIQTHDNAFSTFSLNVSDVSFKLAAASLEKGVLPEPASIRSEEFINAFDYRDPEPATGAPIAFAWERARYPFTQNRDLVRFSLKTAALGRQAGRPLNLVLLLDNSGSMERADRVSIIREALRVLATQLQPNDTLSVVLFARTPRLWVDGAPGNQAGKVADEVSGLTPEGGTNLGDALDLAYQTALRHYLPAGINRVVLLTDGAANLGNVEPEELKKKVEANRRQGVALDCFGIGWEGYNDDLLETLTRNGDGRYGFINTPEEAATEFAGQLAGALHVAASDVKVQVEFNSKRVTAYRQIGYAKHQLTKEQFRDNSVDAAELGAAESGNALYVVDVNGGGDGPLATVRVRYKVPGTMQYQEHEWTVPYTGNAAPLEQASPALRLAASASAFSEWLATSPYAAEVTPDSVLGYLRGVPEVYGADGRPKKLEWMIRQAKSLAGKQ